MSVENLNFQGTWKVIECVNITTNSINAAPAHIDGAVFVLQENGEIRWDLTTQHVDTHTFPLFQCDCYEVVYSFVGVSIQMGAISGHMLEFWVDRPVSRDNNNMIMLTFEGWCMIQCQQILSTQSPLDLPFSYLPALTDGFFSDIILNPMLTNSNVVTSASSSSSNSNKEFKLHSVILELSNTKLEELSSLPADVLEIVLYFLYAQSVPSTLSIETALRCSQLAPKRMTDFIQLCRAYVHRTTLKGKIVNLVNQVHLCAEEMLQAFRSHSVTNPSRFCYVIKFALRHALQAFIKLVEVCVLYGEEAPKLTREERLEILRYAKTRLPIFLTQFVALLRCIKNDFSTVKPADRNDIAAQVVPEIEILLESLVNLMREARDSCNDIWAKWSAGTNGNILFGRYWNPDGGEECDLYCETNKSECSSNDDNLTEALFSIFRKREIVKLHSVQGQVVAIFLYLAQKKENFEEMATASKIRCVSRNLEQLLEELPVFLLRIEEIMVAVDDRFQWKDFKFCLQLAISQVCQTIHHLREERDRLKKFFTTFMDLVQSDEFNQSLANLNLIVKEKEKSETAAGDEKCANSFHSVDMSNAMQDDVSQKLTNVHGIQSDGIQNHLNLVTNLCTPRKSTESILAQNSEKLLNSKTHSDMIFEIANGTESTLEIPSHRVIVASRCDWFRRALLSGMKESIQKRIVIHDCSVQVFQLFLKYIYCGQFGMDVSTENLSELIALADRYEIDGLKLSCEQELSLRHLDENSVIFLLSMADQYSARKLKRACMEYVASNPGVMVDAVFEELSPELQMEVYDITMWSKAHRKVFSTTDELLSCPRYMLVPDSPSSSSSPQEEDEDLTPIVPNSTKSHHHSHHHRHHSSSKHRHHSRSRHSHSNSSSNNGNSQSSKTVPKNTGTVDSSNLGNEGEGAEGTTESFGRQGVDREANCLSRLRDVLGHDIPDQELHRIALAADFDVNRALNYFFSTS